MKYALGTIVGTALLGLAKKHSGSSVKLKTMYEAEYRFSQGDFSINTNDFPLDMSDYILEYDQDGDVTSESEDIIGSLNDSIRSFLTDIQYDEEYDTLVERRFGLRDEEEVSVYISEEDDANYQYLSHNPPPYFVDENGKVKHWMIELRFTYKVDTFDKNQIRTLAEVEDRFREVSLAIQNLLKSKFKVTLIDRWGSQIMLDSDETDMTLMVQNKEGRWVPYRKPKSNSSKLRKR
jgi:hypothetical protein